MKTLLALAILAPVLLLANPTNQPATATAPSLVQLRFTPRAVLVQSGATPAGTSYRAFVTNGLMTITFPATAIGLTNTPPLALTGLLSIRAASTNHPSR
jgi:hypothetical protein